MSPVPPRIPAPVAWVLVLVVAVLVYGPCVGFGWVGDDRVLLEGSRLLPDLSTLPRALGRDLFWLADGTVRASPYWRPVITSSYYLDQLVGQGAPWAFHVNNLVVALLGGLVLAKRAGPLSVLAVAVFWFHPMQVEAIANITARTDLYVAVLGTLAVFATGPLGGVLTLLALGCKETALVIPLIAFLGAPCTRAAWLPHSLALVGWALVRTLLVTSWDVDPADAGLPTLLSVATAPAVVGAYILRIALPLWPTVARLPPMPSLALGLAGWATLLVVARWLWSQAPAERRDLGILLLPLVPVSGLLASPVRYAEGFLAWPLVGAALLITRVPTRWHRPVGGVVIGLAVLSALRVPDWASPRTIWEAAVEAHPDDPRARLGLARLVAPENPARALSLVEGSLEREPDRRKRNEAHALAARLRHEAGDNTTALDHLVHAADPTDPEATWALVAQCVLGSDVLTPQVVEPSCAEALTRTPRDGDLWNAAGVVAARAKDWQLARARFAEAVRLSPDKPSFRANLDRVDGVENGQQ